MLIRQLSFQPPFPGSGADIRRRWRRDAASLLQPQVETAAATGNVWALGKDAATVQALARGMVRVEGPILEPIVIDVEKRAVRPIVAAVCLS